MVKRLAFLFLFFGGAAWGGQTPNQYSIDGIKSLLGFGFHFNEPDGTTFADVSTNSQVGSFVGSGNAIVSGLWGNAVSFNGNGCVTIPASVVHNVRSFSVAFWMYPDSEVVGRTGLMTKSAGAGNYSVSLFNFKIESNISFDANSQVFGTSYISTSTWTHVAVVRRNNFRTEVWVNGVMENSAVVDDQDLNVTGANNTFVIGGINNCTTGFFTGRIEDAFFWQRDLSAGEIVYLAKERNRVKTRSDSGGY